MLIAKAVGPNGETGFPPSCMSTAARGLQTVRREHNARLYDLLQAFYALTGVPVLARNTSFNVKGEPIVETPQDAVECFSRPASTICHARPADLEEPVASVPGPITEPMGTSP